VILNTKIARMKNGAIHAIVFDEVNRDQPMVAQLVIRPGRDSLIIELGSRTKGPHFQTDVITDREFVFIENLEISSPPKDYWGDDDEHPVRDWQYEVENGSTREGYHDWVKAQKE